MCSDVLSCSQKLVVFVILLFLGVFHLGSLWGGISFYMREVYCLSSTFWLLFVGGFFAKELLRSFFHRDTGISSKLFLLSQNSTLTTHSNITQTHCEHDSKEMLYEVPLLTSAENRFCWSDFSAQLSYSAMCQYYQQRVT